MQSAAGTSTEHKYSNPDIEPSAVLEDFVGLGVKISLAKIQNLTFNAVVLRQGRFPLRSSSKVYKKRI